jgi:Mg-chelatase subunit ChlD/cell division protein FtsB
MKKNIALTLVLLCLSIYGFGQVTGRDRPQIEVVFALDTTGSMSALIAAAKEKIWSIASTLATAEPTPDIKIGLVGYRDRGDEYVTVRTDLTQDLDAIYSELMEFQAGGGGDTPESVNQALYEAITAMSWSEDRATYKVVFLVGDAPPHMDYHDDIPYHHSAKIAAESGIVLNTIQCGWIDGTQEIWQSISLAAEGKYFLIENSNAAVVYSTPYDEELAELGRLIEATKIYYGDKSVFKENEVRRATAEKIYEEAAPSAVAQRMFFNSTESGKANFYGRQELLNDQQSGTVNLIEIPRHHLPEEFQGLSRQELRAEITRLQEQREALEERIKQLNSARQNHIRELAKAEEEKSTFDHQVFESLKEQSALKDIHLNSEMVY